MAVANGASLFVLARKWWLTLGVLLGMGRQSLRMQSGAAAAAHPSTAAVQDRAARCWPPPVHGSWKINTDAAVDSTRGLVGVALLRGLWFAVDLGVPSAVVESDAAVVVDCVKAGVVLGSNFGLVLHDIFLVLEQGIFSSVGFAPRECNKAAHCHGLSIF
ncbi:hypothetical protein ACOSQ3_014210 [Xanthoceras sorbifolium]